MKYLDMSLRIPDTWTLETLLFPKSLHPQSDDSLNLIKFDGSTTSNPILVIKYLDRIFRISEIRF